MAMPAPSPAHANLLRDLRRKLLANPPTLPAIFQTGDRILAATADPAATPKPQRVAVLGSVTLDYLARTVACAILAEGTAAAVYQAPFGAYVQQVLDPASPLHGFAPDLAVIAPDWRDLVAPLPIGASVAEVEAALAEPAGLFAGLWDRLAAKRVKIIQHTLVPPAARYCGIAERLAPAAPANQVRRLNAKLLEAGRGRVHWVDMAALAEQIGARNFGATRFWHAAKLDFDPRWLPDYLAPFRAAWRAAHARTKKVLVLDLDNTLWGGVIGEDGADGIAIGPGSTAGETFAEFQSYLKALGERGVVLAVCSKNSPAVAATGFDAACSVLGRADFAAFECSWNDKAAGLRRIAQALNLGLDSFVFADDNPAECELVRQELPEVAVVHLGDDPGRFIETLDEGHWFDLPHYTAEDLGRASAYTARAAALAEQSQATDLGGFLAGLAMQGRSVSPGGGGHPPRGPAGTEDQPVQPDHAALQRSRDQRLPGARRCDRAGVPAGRPAGRPWAGLHAGRAAAGRDAAHRQLADELPGVLPLGRAVHPARADRAGAPARGHAAGRRIPADGEERRGGGPLRAAGLHPGGRRGAVVASDRAGRAGQPGHLHRASLTATAASGPARRAARRPAG